MIETILLSDAKITSVYTSKHPDAPECINCKLCDAVLHLTKQEENYTSRTVIAGYHCKACDDFVEPTAYCTKKIETDHEHQ